MPRQTPQDLAFPVAQSFDGYVLRDFLAKMGVSAGLARQVKRTGGFFADGRPLRTCDRVAAGMTVRFALPPEPPTTAAAEDIPLRIAYESEHAVVLDKPAGMAVHPTLNYAGGTLANAWMGCLAARGETGVFRPVNRIDCNTSGLVLCAKNAFAAPLLAESAEKWYLALVEGTPPEEKGVIDAPIGRAPGSIILRCVCAGGKPSLTEYEVVRRCGAHTLVKARTVTGRPSAAGPLCPRRLPVGGGRPLRRQPGAHRPPRAPLRLHPLHRARFGRCRGGGKPPPAGHGIAGGNVTGI